MANFLLLHLFFLQVALGWLEVLYLLGYKGMQHLFQIMSVSAGQWLLTAKPYLYSLHCTLALFLFFIFFNSLVGQLWKNIAAIFLWAEVCEFQCETKKSSSVHTLLYLSLGWTIIFDLVKNI